MNNGVIKLANFYKKNKQKDRAIQLVEEALEKVQSRMGEVYEWLFKEYKKNKEDSKILELYNKALKKKRNLDTVVNLMCQYYKDDYEKRKPYLLKMVEVCDHAKIKQSYYICQRELKEDDFKQEHKHLQDVVKERSIPQYNVSDAEAVKNDILKGEPEQTSSKLQYGDIERLVLVASADIFC